MINYKIRKTFILFGLLLSHIHTINAGDLKPIRLMADEWCPYNCSPQKDPGYAIEIFREIFLKKYDVDYKVTDWTLAIDWTRSGKNEVLVAATPGDAPDFIYPKESIGLSRLCFYSNHNIRWKYKGLPSLKNIKLGVIKSYSYGEKLDQYIEENKNNNQKIDYTFGDFPLKEVSNKLLNNKIDLFVENENVMLHYLKQNKQDKLFKNIGCEDPLKLFMAFSPKDPNSLKYSQEFDAGIRQLRKSGRLYEILHKYSVSDWENPILSSIP